MVPGRADRFRPYRLSPRFGQRRKEVILAVSIKLGILAVQADGSPIVARIPDDGAPGPSDHPAPIPARIDSGGREGAGIANAGAPLELDPYKGVHIAVGVADGRVPGLSGHARCVSPQQT